MAQSDEQPKRDIQGILAIVVPSFVALITVLVTTISAHLDRKTEINFRHLETKTNIHYKYFEATFDERQTGYAAITDEMQSTFAYAWRGHQGDVAVHLRLIESKFFRLEPFIRDEVTDEILGQINTLKKLLTERVNEAKPGATYKDYLLFEEKYIPIRDSIREKLKRELFGAYNKTVNLNDR